MKNDGLKKWSQRFESAPISESRQRHSRAYHRFFEGYSELQRIDDKDNLRIERVYVGNYYRQDISDRQWALRKILSMALFLFAAVLLVLAGTRYTDMNRAFYVALPVAASFFGVFCMLVPMYYKITAPREMTVRTYRYVSQNLVSVCMIVMVLYIITAAAALAYLIAMREVPLAAASIFSLSAYFAGSIALFMLWRLEKTATYITLPPRNTPPDKSNPIKYESSF